MLNKYTFFPPSLVLDLEILLFTCLQLRQDKLSLQQSLRGQARIVVPGWGKAVLTSFVKFFHQIIKAFSCCLVEIKLRLCLCVQRKRGIERWL